MTKAVYVFANRSDAELVEKIVRVRVGDKHFYNPITVEPSEVVGQWVLTVPNLPQDTLFDWVGSYAHWQLISGSRVTG